MHVALLSIVSDQQEFIFLALNEQLYILFGWDPSWPPCLGPGIRCPEARVGPGFLSTCPKTPFLPVSPRISFLPFPPAPSMLHPDASWVTLRGGLYLKHPELEFLSHKLSTKVIHLIAFCNSFKCVFPNERNCLGSVTTLRYPSSVLAPSLPLRTLLSS